MPICSPQALSDQDWDASGVPGIVRDAMVFYSFSDHFYISMGQGKLPGNRQRVISSGQQQFTENKIVTLGLTRYLPSHRNKLQLNVSHLSSDMAEHDRKNRWNVMLQVELGI